ncbi:NmrA domain-containing protein [Mycena sanguinolenta]|uniref:NmrA domain-containing protein n=1 Tax=Mycena sanguinolenta TaxID=230812 RepID=A0A8H6Y286_9AGAR|nr:NmrA domain-containing protein [Mycena sanguinolenta]
MPKRSFCRTINAQNSVELPTIRPSTMPIISIFGATGSQGSAVVDAVLADGKYTPRAISRRLDSDASKALIARGVEVVVGNLWDVESLKKAIRGSEAVFAVTNFWDPEVFPADPKGKGEITQGKNLVDAAKAEGIKFFIWSSLPNITELSKGLYTHVYHCDNKAVILEYLKASGVPYAVLFTGWFIENLWKVGSLQKTDSGYIIPIPKFAPEDRQSATWVAHDLGQAALALLKHYAEPSKKVLGREYPVMSFKFTYPRARGGDRGRTVAIKKPVTFVPVESAGMAELDEMFLFQAKTEMYNDTAFPNPDLVALGVKFSTLEEFIQKEVVPRFA